MSEVIASIDIMRFDGEITESLYFSNREELLNELRENIDVGGPFEIVVVMY